MTPDDNIGFRFDASLQRMVAASALGVLVFASLAGLWMATLLIWPHAGRWMAPLTYGRWAPLHLDLQLYGWCSLPAIGLLLRRFLPHTREAARYASLALAAWLGSLAAGAVGWLAGNASGKLFLDWKGPEETAFIIAQLFLWSVLAAGWLKRRGWKTDSSGNRLIDICLLTLLLFVPLALAFGSDANVYPPINPDSGGATGHSLMASSLGVVGIALVLPMLLGRPAHRPWRRPAVGVAGLFLANWALYALIGHGNASNHSPDQVGGLATLALWPFALTWWFRHFDWESTHKRWLLAAAAWALFLVVDGLFLFLPGVLERVKFGNALVAHSHLAMAGMVTSLNFLMLVSLAPRSRVSAALAARNPWLLWNIATLAMVLVLTGLGMLEGPRAGMGTVDPIDVQAFYTARWVAGLAMLGAAIYWFTRSIVRRRRTGYTQPAIAGTIIRRDKERKRSRDVVPA